VAPTSLRASLAAVAAVATVWSTRASDGRERAGFRLDDSAGRLDLGTRATYLLDPEHALRAEELLAPGSAARFAALGRSVRSFGPSASALWIRADLEGGGERVLVWEIALVRRLDVWVARAGGLEHASGGFDVPPVERGIAFRAGAHRVPVALAPGERAALLLRVEAPEALVACGSLLRRDALETRDHRAAAALGLDLGLVLVMVAFGLYGWRALRDAAGLPFAAIFACFGGYQLAHFGYASALLPEWPRVGSVLVTLLASLCAPGILAYLGAFVGAAQHHPRLWRAARALSWASVAPAALSIAAPRLAVWPAAAIVVAAGILSLALAVAAARRGGRPERILLASWVAFLVLALAYVGALVGALPASRSALTAVHVAFFALGALALVAHFDRSDAARRIAIAEADVRFRLAFETSPDAININRLEDGLYVAVNDGFTRLTGWSAPETVGRSSSDLAVWADPEDRERLVRGLGERGIVENLEASFRMKDGTVRAGLMSARVVPIGGVPHILSITRDISDRKRAEADRDRLADELRQSQKLEAIGRLAGGVAHDFNNLLTAITANAALAREDLGPDHPARASIEGVLDAARRAAGLTRQLLAFGRRQPIEPRPLDLSACVEGMRGILAPLLGERVELELRLAPGLPAAVADPVQVEQVLINLAANARDAIAPGGGRITVTTAARTVERAGTGARAGRYVELAVSDDGAGIPPHLLPHVFEPFFTTKAPGAGTGLGLATVYGIARQHGGLAEISSEVGRGTTVRVLFPESDLASRPDPPPARARPARTHAWTVLLAEDDPAVREGTRQILRRMGCGVLVAIDGEHALAQAAAHAGPLDVLVSDVMMPRLHGRELAERLRVARPNLGVVFVSGYAQELLDPGAGGLPPGTVFLQKPYTAEQLADALERASAPVADEV